MTAKQEAFVNAYLTTAGGNGTKAAISAGYSEATASVIASQLLRKPHIRAAVERKLDKANITTDRALKNIGLIACTAPEKLTGADVLRANELILKVNGALQQKQQESRITVNIGFLNTSQPATITIDTDATRISNGNDNMQLMPPSAQVPTISSGD